MSAQKLIAGAIACLFAFVALQTPSYGQSLKQKRIPKTRSHNWVAHLSNGNHAGRLQNGRSYRLGQYELLGFDKNGAKTGKLNYLRYKSRRFGINLEMSSSPPSRANMAFYRKGSSHRSRVRDRRKPIQYGERIAIYVKGRGYLKYKKRRWGINIQWSEDPVYEWELRFYPQHPNYSINSNVEGRFTIYNTKVRSELMHCHRLSSPTVNLAWRNTCYLNEIARKVFKP